MEPRYNIAPSQPILAVREDHEGGEREMTFLSWGLVPFWADDPKIGNRMINARSETAHEKPSFRAAFKYRRCIIPADGFYEWKKQSGAKQPMLIHKQDDSPFGFAGLWERWEKDGSAIESCTILTTEPNELLRSIHNRMPVILEPADYDEWLDRSVQAPDPLRHLMRPYTGGDLTVTPVSTLVNNPRNEDPACVQPLAESGGVR